MKKKFIATVVAICAIILIASALTACAPKGHTKTEPTVTTTSSNVFNIPEVKNVGGYEIKTDAIFCKVVVNNTYKYACFESYGNDRKVEFYASPTEMILIDVSNGQTQYYYDTYEDVGQVYANPIGRLYAELENMDFHYFADETNYQIFESIQTSTVVESENIRYNVYSIEMDWRDGKHYSYKYYDYADGSTLISAEAPDEINPRLVEDTKWIVDLDAMNIHNTETKETLPINIIDVSVGEGLSPDNKDSTIVEKQYYVYVYVNSETGEIEKLRYSKDEGGTEVNVLNEFDVAKPVITNDMGQMDENALQLNMMLIYMLESLI
jgi:hypothetical protein